MVLGVGERRGWRVGAIGIYVFLQLGVWMDWCSFFTTLFFFFYDCFFSKNF